MNRFAWWQLGTIAILVAGLIVFPAVVAGQSSNIQISVEAPQAMLTVANGQIIDVRGWAADLSMDEGAGPGITSIEITVDADAGMGGQPLPATYGVSRPDIAQAYGRPDWENVGFSASWTPRGLTGGTHTIQVWANTTSKISRFQNVMLGVITPTPMLATWTTTAKPATPTLPISYREGQRIGCEIDVSLIAPAAYMNRPCPTPRMTVTPTPGGE